MNEAIENYLKAESVMNAAIVALNDEVTKVMTNNPSVADIHNLLDILPERYMGKRRLYEHLIRLDEPLDRCTG